MLLHVCSTAREMENMCSIFVDDGVVVATDIEELDEFMEMLQQEFHTTRGYLRNLFGMRIQKNEEGSITIDQEDYTRKVLERFEMTESNGLSIPMAREDNDEGEKVTAKVTYREAVGSLMYSYTS